MDRFLFKQNSQEVGSNTDDNEIENESNENTPPKKRKIIYSQKYKLTWEKQYKWLTYKDNLKSAFCTVCNKKVAIHLSHIKRHDLSEQHIVNYKKAEATPVLEVFGFNNTSYRTEVTAKKAEYKMLMFLHEHNLPFLLMEHFPQLIRSVCPDSDIAKKIECSRTKATQLTKECLSTESIENIRNKLGQNFYSLIIDETTDISTQKSLVILIRYFDGEDVRDNFLGLVRLMHCTADSIYQAVIQLLKDCQIPLENLIGFAADNAAVMQGNKNGVQAKFKELYPNIFILGCTCHTFHLCASAAAQKLPKSIEEFSRNIFNYFSNSSYRSEGLGEFQLFTNIKPCKMLHPSQTRWLSLQAVVERILRSWDALKLFFIDAVLKDNLNVSNIILDSLNTLIYKVYFLFLSYILDIINKLNLEFQSESPKIYLLSKRVAELYRTILRNYIDIKVLNKLSIKDINPANPDYFLSIENIYYGAKVEMVLPTCDAGEVLKFKKNALAFYIELATQIRRRFDFQDEVLIFINNFDPQIAVSGELNSIVNILKIIPKLTGLVDVEKLNTEWRMLADVEQLKIESLKTFTEFWSHVCTVKNAVDEYMFPNLSICIKAVMCLPHSSACAERIFSQLTLLKTKTRNRLEISTCDSILHAKQLLNKNKCFSWDPPETLLKKKPSYKKADK